MVAAPLRDFSVFSGITGVRRESTLSYGKSMAVWGDAYSGVKDVVIRSQRASSFLVLAWPMPCVQVLPVGFLGNESGFASAHRRFLGIDDVRQRSGTFSI